ncbi:A/G-specific adenine glycosylase [Roseiconus lacunae]|uniref:A/G-specific adenine glycosylase n=1 Tax=Roseiconus lacunae TaxID=2605694 RepID=UPI001F1ACD59|nr:A/G-specific adenine glycosylase [Roseiconus lacunae]
MTDAVRRNQKRKPQQTTVQKAQAESQDVPHDLRCQASSWRRDVRRRLFAWFEDHARVLPWRSEPTPYRVWVSEIMLQQTQVATVLPYYERWMRQYPTVVDLANADEADLMRIWEGLGYYRRVRSMHAAAKRVVQEHEGKFPTDFDAVLALPGIGRYTAGAILSIACDQRLPILEGNTQRVFSRWAAMSLTPTETKANKWLWQFSEKLLPQHECGTFNQAAMEIGALVCTPKKPKCDECPIRQLCCTAAAGLQESIPGKITRVKYEDRMEFALVLSRKARGQEGQEYLVRQLPDDARWAGLWDFPRPTEVETKTVDAAARWLEGELGTPVRVGARLKTIRHAVTKFRIQLHVHSASVNSKQTRSKLRDPLWRWVRQDDLANLPMSVTGRKIVHLLAQSEQSFLPLE